MNDSRWAPPLLVAAATFAAFWPALGNGFVSWDDPFFLLDNPNFRGLGWPYLKWMLANLHGGLYQPLTWLSYAVDFKLWGLEPFGYHLTSAALHAAAAAALYLAAVEIFEAARWESPRSAAALSALLWSAHPLRVESVAWATERRDVLSGAFYLLAIWGYLKAHRAKDGPAGFRRFWTLSLCAYALSLCAKAIGFTLPLALLALDAYPLKRLDSPCVWKEKLPYAGLGLLAAAVGIYAQLHSGNVMDAPTWWARVVHSSYSLVFYLVKTVLPWPLSPFYPGLVLTFREGLGFAAAVGAAVVGVFAFRRRFPAFAAAVFFYGVTLAPVSGLVQYGPQLVADRYSYLACLPWALLVGGLLARRKGGVFAGGGAILVLASLCHVQARVWRDSETFWKEVLVHDPSSSAAHNNLGVLLKEAKRYPEAAEHYREAARLDPKNEAAFNNLGNVYRELGDLAKAEEQYRLALKAKPGYARALGNLGKLAAQRGDAAGAIRYYREGLASKPGDAELLSSLAEALAARGDSNGAVGQLERLVASRPASAAAHYNLSLQLGRQGDIEAALKHLNAALRLDPGYRPARELLDKIEASRAGEKR